MIAIKVECPGSTDVEGIDLSVPEMIKSFVSTSKASGSLLRVDSQSKSASVHDTIISGVFLTEPNLSC